MKSTKKAFTSAQVKRKEKQMIGDTKIVNGIEFQLVGHFDCGRQYWKRLNNIL